MSASRRERKLQRAAQERTQQIFGRVFGPNMDRMAMVAQEVLRLCLPIAVAATEQPRDERFRWFLQQLPDRLLESLNTVTGPVDEDDPVPVMAPVLITFTAWARMLLYGSPENDWRAPMSLGLEAEGAQHVLMLTQLELVARLGAYERYEYPNDPWDADGPIIAEGAREEVMERIRQESAAAGEAEPNWLPPLDRTQLPFKLADDL